ncbi:CLUMA_CG006688, isoform A [Clunio marinus]|uniref:CLUMA_CG006688, isoform A n=1 Tax=Clunio marinus TaxID=568069 RepID=A0A1J1HYK9_9DIPT|nr:CLUMA_CG006688, isoform A [Clunio marinus]
MDIWLQSMYVSKILKQILKWSGSLRHFHSFTVQKGKIANSKISVNLAFLQSKQTLVDFRLTTSRLQAIDLTLDYFQSLKVHKWITSGF